MFKLGLAWGFAAAVAAVPLMAQDTEHRPSEGLCNRGPYVVFFDWGAAALTPEARTILTSAATAYRNCANAPVTVAGHADSSGADAYNVRLTERRAQAVRRMLVAQGIPQSRISVQARGESEPRVPTAGEVQEAQNRRVEISFGEN